MRLHCDWMQSRKVFEKSRNFLSNQLIAEKFVCKSDVLYLTHTCVQKKKHSNTIDLWERCLKASLNIKVEDQQ